MRWLCLKYVLPWNLAPSVCTLNICTWSPETRLKLEQSPRYDGWRCTTDTMRYIALRVHSQCYRREWQTSTHLDNEITHPSERRHRDWGCLVAVEVLTTTTAAKAIVRRRNYNFFKVKVCKRRGHYIYCYFLPCGNLTHDTLYGSQLYSHRANQIVWYCSFTFSIWKDLI